MDELVTMVMDEPTGKAILKVDEYGCISPPVEVTLKRKPHFINETLDHIVNAS